MMTPWRSQQNPTSDPDRIIGRGMWRVHFSFNVFHIPMMGRTKKQYIMEVSRRPKRVSTLAGSSTFEEKKVYVHHNFLYRLGLAYLWICNCQANERSSTKHFYQTRKFFARCCKVNVQRYINHHDGKSNGICLKRRIIVKHLAEANVKACSKRKTQ